MKIPAKLLCARQIRCSNCLKLGWLQTLFDHVQEDITFWEFHLKSIKWFMRYLANNDSHSHTYTQIYTITSTITHLLWQNAVKAFNSSRCGVTPMMLENSNIFRVIKVKSSQLKFIVVSCWWKSMQQKIIILWWVYILEFIAFSKIRLCVNDVNLLVIPLIRLMSCRKAVTMETRRRTRHVYSINTGRTREKL